LEESRFRPSRIGERALLETEEFRLEQRVGNRSAVDVDERTSRAWSEAMQDRSD